MAMNDWFPAPRTPKDTYYVYGLIDPRTDEIRYAGMTGCEPRHRVSLHCTDARKGKRTPCARWIRRLLELDLYPSFVILEVIQSKNGDGEERGRIAELRWIKQLEENGSELLNIIGANQRDID